MFLCKLFSFRSLKHNIYSLLSGERNENFVFVEGKLKNTCPGFSSDKDTN